MVHDLLRQHLLRAQQIMKRQADKNRTFREFQVNDMIFLKLQPYIQASVAPRANHKLLFKFYGPFRVVARISDIAYKLALPEGSTIHPVFHVSLLRKCLADGMTTSSPFPSDTNQLAVPCKVLAQRWRKKANGVVEQVLVQWSPGDAAAATWEDRLELKTRFPLAPAWGQAGSQAGRGVREPGSTDMIATGVDDQGQAKEAIVSDIAPQGPEETRRGARPTKPNSKYVGPEWTR